MSPAVIEAKGSTGTESGRNRGQGVHWNCPVRWANDRDSAHWLQSAHYSWKGRKANTPRTADCGAVQAVRLGVKGFIQFTIGGGIERRSQFGGQTSSAVDDENSVLFDTFQQHAFEELRDAVQSALADHHGFSGASQRTEPAVDIPKQIKQLAELRDSGVLDDAEFGAKKAELLRRM